MNPQTLATVPPFSKLPMEEIEFLQANLSIVQFEAGQILFKEGHSDDKLFILVDGQVEIVKALGLGEERVLGIRDAGTLLGEMSLFNREGCHTASVRSISPLTLIKITHADLDALLLRQPQLAHEIIKMFSNRLEESENATIVELKEKNRRLQIAYDELAAAQDQIIEKEKLEKELEIAANIQRSILPESLPALTGYEIGAMMVPARLVGGDFYTFLELGNNRLGLVVGDVCGKGIPSAIFMALSFSLIRAEAARTTSPLEAIQRVNSQLLQMNAEGMFVTLVYGILDCTTGNFHYVRAGHTSPYIANKDGHTIEFKTTTGQPLGIFEEIIVDENQIQLPPGGMLMLYSDGVTEPENTEGDEFGIDLLNKTMKEHRSNPAAEICDKLWTGVQTFSQGIPQQDDFTVVIIKRAASLSS